MSVDPRLRAAVDGSLAWYVDLFAAHGVPAALSGGVFRALAAPPPLHSAAITVEPGALLALPLPGGVADNFHDVEPEGLSLLFSATWVHRPALHTRSAPLPPGWSQVTSADGLAAWNAAGDTTGVVLPALLERATFAVLEKQDADGPTAGCIATLGAGAAYLSNVHAAPGRRCDWDEVVAAVSATFPDRPLVGYERGDDLDAAVRSGFVAVGDKRVWVP